MASSFENFLIHQRHYRILKFVLNLPKCLHQNLVFEIWLKTHQTTKSRLNDCFSSLYQIMYIYINDKVTTVRNSHKYLFKPAAVVPVPVVGSKSIVIAVVEDSPIADILSTH